ncbi:MAG: tetratricopeptide repeat protein [Bacteroidia bacterium]
MKKIIVLFFIHLFVITSLFSQTSDCKSYKEGIAYFKLHYHGDYMDKGAQEETIRLLEKAIEEGCSNYDLYYKLYFCCNWNGETEKADQYISKAIQLDSSKNIELYYWRGELNMKLKKFNEALSDYQYYVSDKKASELSTGYYRIGALQYVLGDSINSQESMTKAVELNQGRKLRDYEDFARSWGWIK